MKNRFQGNLPPNGYKNVGKKVINYETKNMEIKPMYFYFFALVLPIAIYLFIKFDTASLIKEKVGIQSALSTEYTQKIEKDKELNNLNILDNVMKKQIKEIDENGLNEEKSNEDIAIEIKLKSQIEIVINATEKYAFFTQKLEELRKTANKSILKTKIQEELNMQTSGKVNIVEFDVETDVAEDSLQTITYLKMVLVDNNFNDRKMYLKLKLNENKTIETVISRFSKIK